MVRQAHASPFTPVGRIVRAHGLHGECKIELEPEYITLPDSLSLMYVRNERGDFIPCRIQNVRTEGKGNTISFFVQFDHIADRNAAERLKNRLLFLEPEIAESMEADDSENHDSLLDFEVFDDNRQSIGLVIDEMDSGVQQVITVATTSGSLLIPLVEEYIREIDREHHSVYCQNLDQLEGL